MTWYIVYLHGPAIIGGKYYPHSTRIVDGLRAKNDAIAGVMARMRNPIESCDYMTVKPTTAAIGEGARRGRIDCQVTFERAAKKTIY